MAETVTQKHICSQCNGKGTIPYPGEDCGFCKGRGYIETIAGDEAVCPSCKGEGFNMASRPCRGCRGKGFRVSVYEVTDYVTPCLPCGGTGWIHEEYFYSDFYGNHVDQRQVECLVCHGQGNITEQRIKRIK